MTFYLLLIASFCFPALWPVFWIYLAVKFVFVWRKQSAERDAVRRALNPFDNLR